MHAAAFLLCGVLLATGSAAARAQSTDWHADPFMLLAERDESAGRNVPNFRYDDQHTAGGNWQITDTNWRTFAPQLDIDLNKYPNAGSAPRDIQGQVGFLMKARLGVLPWICCNVKLRHELGVTASPRAGPGVAAIGAASTPPNATAPEVTHQWDVFPDDESARNIVPPDASNIPPSDSPDVDRVPLISDPPQ